ncbi:dynamin family protein [Romboutsia sp. 1001713B170131_170501_G6]|uniref:dynamin family protein n=1 Tax=Romboutsia sp. 1001713B170131_170501_G6 TaxID=2787108 RepID=UPI0018AA3930|nr:dynamin family protein [Romboutsia sp. 1001713B170131_170501_G6]
MYNSRYEELNNIMKIIIPIENEISNIIKYVYTKDKTKSIDIIDYIQKEITKLKNNVKELENPFVLCIVGCGNYGKSTLINSLIKREIVATKDIPNTWKIDIFLKSNLEKIEIIYNNKEKILKSIQGGYRLLKNEEDKYKKSKEKIYKLVQECKKENTKTKKELKEYKRELEEKYLYKSQICKVKYYLKEGNLINDFTIVDTPGLNQSLLNTDNKVDKYYEIADGIIWIIDAQNIVSSENTKLINEINDIDKNYSNKNIIAVVNKIDIIKEKDLNKVKDKCEELFKDKFKDIVYISAKDAIKGILSKDYYYIKKSNIEKLYKSIDVNFKKLCENKQIESKYKNLYITKRNILQSIYSHKRELYKDLSIYNEIDYELKYTLDNIKKDALSYIKDIDIETKDYIISLQNKCNNDFSNIYDIIYEKSNFNKDAIYQKIDTDINLDKIQVPIQKQSKDKIKEDKLENLLNKFLVKAFNEDVNPKQNYLSKNKEIITKDIEKILKDNINTIISNIEYIKNHSFEKVYIDYKYINIYIDFLNNIERILNTLG